MGRDGIRIVLMVASAMALAGSILAAESTGGRLDELKALVKAGKYADAESGARARLTEVEAANGAESVEAASVLDLLVEVLWREGKFKDPASRDLAQRAVRIKEKALGADHPDVATSLNILATLLRDTGDYAGARPLYERALVIREKALGPDHPDVAKSLNNLAILLRYTGDYAGARPLYERALAIREKALGPDHPEVAQSLNNLAIVRWYTGDYAGARPLYERALAISEKAFGPDHSDVASSLSNLGVLLQFTGDYAGARPLCERSLAIWEKLLGPDHPDVATSLNNLAVLLRDTGDYAGARQLQQRALAIREKALGPDHPDVAKSLNNLADLLQDTGDYAGARPLQERALAIREKALGAEHPETAGSLNSLAGLLRIMGDYAGARPLFERALAIREKVHGPEHANTAAGLTDLAWLLMTMGEYGAARPLFERALTIDEKALGPDHPGTAQCLSSLAVLLRETGDYTEARPLFERALAIQEKVHGTDHPTVAFIQSDLAQLLARKGDTTAAFDHALAAERIGREHLRLTGRSLSEQQALRYAAVRASGLDLVLTLAARGLDPASRRRALDALVRSRAVVLDEMATRHRAVSGAADPNVARLATTLASARTRLANLVIRGLGDQKPEIYRKLLDDARQEKEQAERALAGASANFARELSRSGLGLDEVAASLPAGSALVALSEYRRIDFAQGSSATSPGENAQKAKAVLSCLAFVLRSGDRDPQVVDLGAAAAIDGLVARWKKEASGAGSEAAYREVGTILRKSVWDPLAPAIGDAGRVFVVPDGALNLVNLAALPLNDGGYLVERGPVVHYVSAERDLVTSSETRHGEGLLALGAPSYDATSLFTSLRKGPTGAGVSPPPKSEPPILVASAPTYRGQHSACGDFASVRFGPLPATGKETREIVRLWERHRPSDSSPANVALDLREAAASETSLKRSAPGRRVLHLATHGFFLGGGNCESALASTRGIGGLVETPMVKSTDRPPAVAGENPLLLSGLVLAGANHRSAAREGEDDGILTAEEIASLDLSGVEWAVLSACETGVGDVRAGEGVFGLRRAFQVAGAGTLIMSLWSVDDEATRAWMRALYAGRLEEHLDTVEAVRKASLTVMKQRRKMGLSTHPFYWAAFVAAGDWR